MLASVPGRSLILPLYPPQLQKERGDHEATRERLRGVEEEHEKLRSSECTVRGVRVVGCRIQRLSVGRLYEVGSIRQEIDEQ